MTPPASPRTRLVAGCGRRCGGRHLACSRGVDSQVLGPRRHVGPRASALPRAGAVARRQNATDGVREQFEFSAQADEALADVADARTVVVAEVRDGLEVRRCRTLSHITSTLRWAPRSRRRLDRMRFG